MDTVALLEFDIKVPPLLFTHLFTYNFTHQFTHHFTHNFRLFLTKNCPTTAQSAQMAILWKILFLNDSEIYQSLNILYLVLYVSTNHLKIARGVNWGIKTDHDFWTGLGQKLGSVTNFSS